MHRILLLFILLSALVSCKVYDTPNKDRSSQKKEFLDFVQSSKEKESDDGNELILKNVSIIRDNFIDAIKKEGVTVLYYPKVEVVNIPALMSFWGDRNFGYLLTLN